METKCVKHGLMYCTECNYPQPKRNIIKAYAVYDPDGEIMRNTNNTTPEMCVNDFMRLYNLVNDGETSWLHLTNNGYSVREIEIKEKSDE